MFQEPKFDEEAKNEFMPARRNVKGVRVSIVHSNESTPEPQSPRESGLTFLEPIPLSPSPTPSDESHHSFDLPNRKMSVFMERRFSQSHFTDQLSNRARLLAAENCFLSKHMFSCIQSPWSEKTPSGYINLGTAENLLTEDIIVDKFMEPGFFEFTPEMLHYFPYHGSKSCRTALAKFITKYFKASLDLDSEKLLLILGTCSALDVIAHLTADPGDVFLCPSPFYTRIRADIFERSLVDIVDIVLSGKTGENQREPFTLTLEKVIETYEEADERGENVKGLILLNPNNPLGSIYSKEVLMPIFEFAESKQLYVIVDEIYGLTVHDEESTFESVLSYYDDLPNPERVIWMWGFSKDFCNPGMRSSVLYLDKPSLLVGAKKLITYSCVPSMIHTMIEKFVSDYDWLDNVYFPNNIARIRVNYGILYHWLKRMKINFYPAKAGFYMFIDMRPYLEEQSFTDERRLFDNFFHSGVYIVPGHELFCAEPGWFRVVFTAKPEALKEGVGWGILSANFLASLYYNMYTAYNLTLIIS